MAGARVSPLASTIVLLALSLVLCTESSSQHHVVGADRGWDPSSNVASWSAGRIFLVGDSLWFTYSAAQEKIVELSSKEEYEACNLSNPIRMYTDGLSKVALDGEGTRYFASGNSESCKKGLKLPVKVKSKSEMAKENHAIAQSEEAAVADVEAEPPSSPSGAGRVFGGAALGLGALLGGVFFLLF